MTLALKYVPVLVLFALALMIPLIMLGIAGVTGPRQGSPRKFTPFESGVESIGDTRHRFSVRFFLVALLFIIFDIEAVFIYPWAVLFRELGLFGLVEMTIFLTVLLLGLFYVWKKGALEWE
ncbi:MAG: NADH-quinone oxidoreductase subunit A [Candidatus Krumholzibacteria bacterium]|nr:NADH-quinone oxidoreductase subunit A [Candidatus Krumholzibacteria bacterium]MDH4337907.1 NADH-quinone oxidoreductase subunit A [Candidatus Krumholzibacteria bacterium]MDH5270208.1 NADH-quinone oxidoreductase subunit A [Candidatus Krumholzibacteria bacterium]